MVSNWWYLTGLDDLGRGVAVVSNWWYLTGLDDLGRGVPVHLTPAGHELLDLLHRTGHTGQQLHAVTRYQDVVLHAGLQGNKNNIKQDAHQIL